MAKNDGLIRNMAMSTFPKQPVSVPEAEQYKDHPRIRIDTPACVTFPA